jgi:hypothetical protein
MTMRTHGCSFFLVREWYRSEEATSMGVVGVEPARVVAVEAAEAAGVAEAGTAVGAQDERIARETVSGEHPMGLPIQNPI